MALLELEGLQYLRGAAAPAGETPFAIQVDSLTLASGQAMAVVGPSGCGKSTLIDLLGLLRRPTNASRFLFRGTNVMALWQRGAVDACTGLRAMHVGVVLQTGGLVPSLPVRENVLMSQRLLGRMDHAWVDQLLAALDLCGLDARLPSQLSFGQRQRVAIARALAHRPSLVLADEPTASLGIDHAPAVLDLLLSLTRSSEAALLIVSHDLHLLQGKGVPLRRCQMNGTTVHLAEVA